MNTVVILVLVVASLIGSGLIFLALRKGSIKRADYDAFAERQGWHCTHGPRAPNGSEVATFQDPNDDWTLTIHFSGGGATGGSTHRRVDWHSPQGALDSGQAVLGLPIPEKAVAMIQGGGTMGQQMLKAALKATLHALGKTPFNLDIDERTAGHPGGVVMASDGQSHAMDALRDNDDLRRFRAARKTADVPVIIRDDRGLTLRRPGAVKSLEELAAIADLGKSLRHSLTVASKE